MADRCVRRSARRSPPASISGSWRGSPTSDDLDVRGGWRGRGCGARWRVPTIPASSTTRTVSAGEVPCVAVVEVGEQRWRWCGWGSRRWLRVRRRPGRTSAGADDDDSPARCQASRAASRLNVLPVAGGGDDDVDAARPEVVSVDDHLDLFARTALGRAAECGERRRPRRQHRRWSRCRGWRGRMRRVSEVPAATRVEVPRDRALGVSIALPSPASTQGRGRFVGPGCERAPTVGSLSVWSASCSMVVVSAP